MLNGDSAQLLRIHVTEGRTFEGTPVHEAIIIKCRELGIAGATVFRGLEGFGETAEVHRDRMFQSDQPLVIVIVDEPARISQLIPEVESILHSGLIAVSGVMARRVRRSQTPEA